MREYGDVNFIFGKTLRVLHETKSPKPVGNLLHIASRFTGPLYYSAAAGWIAYPFCEANVAGFARCSEVGEGSIASFPNCPDLEAHVGIFIAGKSGVAHECDVAVLYSDEACTCRQENAHPRSSQV